MRAEWKVVNERKPETFPVGAITALSFCLPSDGSGARQGAHGSFSRAVKSSSIPWTGAVPKANCDRWDWTESGLQGQTTPWERESGDSEGGYNCNLELVGQFQGQGAISQGGPAYSDHCAYYVTNNNPLKEHRGVAVIDASDPTASTGDHVPGRPGDARPARDSEAQRSAQAPRGRQTNGPKFAVYDTSADCTRPVLKGSIDLPGSSAHMGNFAPDGLTYYIGQSFRGIGGFMHIVDLSDPSNPKQLPPWQFLGDGRPHGSDGSTASPGRGCTRGNPASSARRQPSAFGPNGLVILDVSDYQFRRPNPQVRIVSKLFWDDQGNAEEMYPFSQQRAPVRRQLGRVRRQWWCWRCPGRMCPGGVPAWLSEYHRHHRREEP